MEYVLNNEDKGWITKSPKNFLDVFKGSSSANGKLSAVHESFGELRIERIWERQGNLQTVKLVTQSQTLNSLEESKLYALMLGLN